MGEEGNGMKLCAGASGKPDGEGRRQAVTARGTLVLVIDTVGNAFFVLQPVRDRKRDWRFIRPVEVERGAFVVTTSGSVTVQLALRCSLCV